MQLAKILEDLRRGLFGDYILLLVISIPIWMMLLDLISDLVDIVLNRLSNLINGYVCRDMELSVGSSRVIDIPVDCVSTYSVLPNGSDIVSISMSDSGYLVKGIGIGETIISVEYCKVGKHRKKHYEYRIDVFNG